MFAEEEKEVAVGESAAAGRAVPGRFSEIEPEGGQQTGIIVDRHKHHLPLQRMRSGDIGNLEMLPGGTVVKTDLTENLIFLGSAGFGERLAEEIALVGDVLFDRADAGDIRAEEHAGGHKSVNEDTHRTEVGFNGGEINTGDVSGIREAESRLRGVDRRERLLLLGGEVSTARHF